VTRDPSSLPGADARLAEWLDALAAPVATPAGGAAAAIAGALAGALVEMVAGMTGARERYAAAHVEAAAVRTRAARLRTEMLALAARDAATFAAFGQALALPAGTEEERGHRARAKVEALRAGADVQLALLGSLAETAELGLAMVERGLAGAAGDAATAVYLATGATRSARWAVWSNLHGLADDAATHARGVADGLLERVEEAERGVGRVLEARLRPS
jgi:formiminotetrahydrofolate cyclodeaminase